MAKKNGPKHGFFDATSKAIVEVKLQQLRKK